MAPTSLAYIIWNPSPTALQLGSLSIKWYGLCVLCAFLGGKQIVRYIFKVENKPLGDVEHVSTWVLCGTLIGARIGEILFYNPGYYLTHPIEAFLPVRFAPCFQFIGYAGLSYHGAIIGSIFGAYGYAHYRTTFKPWRLEIKRVKRKGQSLLWLSTPLALALMVGFMVRIGNFVNSEIVGTPTHSAYGVLFTREVTEQLQRQSRLITKVAVHKDSAPSSRPDYQPVTLEITFQDGGFGERVIVYFLEKQIKKWLTGNNTITRHVRLPANKPLNYTLTKTGNKSYVLNVAALGIPRHPVQLYECVAYVITLITHLYWWRRKRKVLRDGVIAGSAMIACYSLRFIGEFFKDPFSVLFDGFVTLTMGHLLSLLTVLGGIFLIRYSYNPYNDTALKVK
jgi:phosphatidylglycerol:prolipoprotein diacylglycerol transferase